MEKTKSEQSHVSDHSSDCVPNFANCERRMMCFHGGMHLFIVM